MTSWVRRADAAFWRFLAVGLVNTVVGLGTIFTAKAFLGFDDLTANAAGYAVGLSLSFLLNKSWTFGFAGDARIALIRFGLVFLVAYALNLSALFLLLRCTPIDAYLAHVIAIASYTAVFYLGSRHYAFAPLAAGRADPPPP